MSGRYVTHARTPEELRREFLSDLQRRLDQQDEFLRRMKPSATEAGRVARVRMELLSLHDYWKQVQIQDPING